MIYESTFSDDLGIIVLYLLIENYKSENAGEVIINRETKFPANPEVDPSNKQSTEAKPNQV